MGLYNHIAMGYSYPFAKVLQDLGTPAKPVGKSRKNLEAALQTLATIDSWRDVKDRDRLRRDVLESLASGAFADGFDQGYDQARQDVSDALN